MTSREICVAPVQAELIAVCELENQEIAQICLIFDDIQIHDLSLSENGFGRVDPEYYGLTDSQRSDIVAANEAIARYIARSSDEMAGVIQNSLNITDGDVAAQVYQGETLTQYILAASTLMANHALQEMIKKWEASI